MTSLNPIHNTNCEHIMKRKSSTIVAQSLLLIIAPLLLISLFSITGFSAEQADPDKPDKPDKSAKADSSKGSKTHKAPSSITPQTAAYAGPTEVTSSLRLTIGKSALVRLPANAARLSIGNPEVADVMLIKPREVYLLGKKVGTTNVFVWIKGGRTTIMDVSVDIDTGALKTKFGEFVASESAVKVASLADSVVLSGNVSDALKVQRLVSLAEVYSGGKKVVNLLTIEGSQQVMLEVKVAEVSKTLFDKLGVEFNVTRHIGNTAFTLLTQFLTGSAGKITSTSGSGNTAITLDAEIQKGLVKILAEPTIMAMSGQEGSFLAGGRIFIPVPQSSSTGASTITLEEKEFGVGLRFTPTLLDEGRINLQVTPEVSELSQVGTPISTLTGQTSILPTITTRRASTTVQLRDGESFAIGGLIKSNVTQAVKAFPILGELPVLGALFRSSEFQTDRSELLFIITPRIVKPLPPNYALPTDNYIPPSRSEFFLKGQMEGEPKPKPVPPPTGQPGGFQLQ